jgi:hypothetical protein
LSKKVTKLKPEEIIPEHVEEGKIDALTIYFADDGEHLFRIKASGQLKNFKKTWSEMDNQEKKLCTDALDFAVENLGVTEVEALLFVKEEHK